VRTTCTNSVWRCTTITARIPVPAGFMVRGHLGNNTPADGPGVSSSCPTSRPAVAGQAESSKYTLEQVINDPALLPMLQMDLSVFRCPSSLIGRLRTHQGLLSRVASANYTCCRGFLQFLRHDALTKQNNGSSTARAHANPADYRRQRMHHRLGERTAFGANLGNDGSWPPGAGPAGGAMNTVSSRCPFR